MYHCSRISAIVLPRAKCGYMILGARRQAICVAHGGGSSRAMLACNPHSAQLSAAYGLKFSVLPARLEHVPPFPTAVCGSLHGSATVSFPRTSRTLSAGLSPTLGAAAVQPSTSSAISALGSAAFHLTPQEAADASLGDYDAVFQPGFGSRYALADNFVATTGQIYANITGPTTAFVGARCAFLLSIVQ